MTEPVASPRETDVVVALLVGMSAFAFFEIAIVTVNTFHRRSGLFFWSFIGASVSGILATLAISFENWVFGQGQPAITLPIAYIGYLGCVTFDYLILYSRLRLFYPSKLLSRGVLVTTMAQSVLIEFPLIIFSIIITLYPNHPVREVLKVWLPMEALAWAMVDAGLSAVYVWLVKRLWMQESGDKKVRRVLWRLIIMCGISLSANMVNVTATFAMTNTRKIEAISLLGFAVQLRVELGALHELTELSRMKLRESLELFATKDSTGFTTLSTSRETCTEPGRRWSVAQSCGKG